MASQTCPICATPVAPSGRYPRYVCQNCAEKAQSIDERPLKFMNSHFSGGFLAHYADTGEPYPGHSCYIDGIPCRADEARFGGIVIQPIE